MYSIIDIEATGGNARNGKITEIAIYRFDGERIVNQFNSLINPECNIPPFVQKLTGISNQMARKAPKFYEVAKEIVETTKNSCFVAHNVKFDYSFLQAEFASLGYAFAMDRLCTLQLSRELMPGMPSYSLGNLCDSLNIPIMDRHRASGDAMATVELFQKLLHIDEARIDHYRRKAK